MRWPDWIYSPRLLRLLSWGERALGCLRPRYRADNPARQSLAAFYEQIWQQAAACLGARVEPLGQGVLEVRLGEARTCLAQNITAIDDLAAHLIVRTRPILYRLLRQHGLPTPRHAIFAPDDVHTGAAFLEESQRACCVGPARDTSGEDRTTAGVRTRWQLARAAFRAARDGSDIVIEEHPPGGRYHLLFLDGELLDAVLCWPGADGGHIGGEGISAADLLCDEVIAECLLATRLVRVRLAGVSIVTPDPTVSLRESGGAILDVRTPPDYTLHYHKRDGAFPLAVPVLRALLNRCAQQHDCSLSPVPLPLALTPEIVA